MAAEASHVAANLPPVAGAAERPYLDPVGKRKRRILGTIALVVPLFAILAAAGWYAAGAWFSLAGPPLPTTGYIAMGLGIAFSILIGCGLMALLFYSSRHGYDEPYRADDERG